MQLRPHSGGVTAKRSTAVLAGVVALAILTALARGPHRQDASSQYLPGPSAVEESGISEPIAMVENGVRLPPEDIHTPRPQISRDRQEAPKGRDNHLTPPAMRPGPSTISEETRNVRDSRVLTPHNLESKLGGDAPVEEGQGPVSVVRSDPQGTVWTPLLTQPVLLSVGSLQYPAEGYRIVVDHSGSASAVGMDAAEGRVGLKILVRADGSVEGVEVAQSSGRSVLDAAAVREVSRWKFAPATRDGQPIDAWVLVPLLFVLR